jgi:predicted dehydrogenase
MNLNLTRRAFIRTSAVAAAAASRLPSALAAGRTVTMALVGCAHIHTPSYVNLLRQRTDVRVKSVWDHDRARAEKNAKVLSAETVSDLKAIWSDPAIAAVVICSETNRHHDLVLAAASAGKHMFVEKPLGITAKESRAMAGAIEKAGLLFTTGYFMRTDPKHLFLRDEIAKGNLGTITRARGAIGHNGSLGGWFDTDWRWMTDLKQAGVGGFGDLGTHKLDILMWLLGDVESVTADIRVVTHRYVDCDETGEGLVQFNNGTIGTLGAGWVDVADSVQLLISGTEGHAVIVDNLLYYKNRKVRGADGQEPYTKLPPAPRPPLYQLVDAVAEPASQPLVTPHEAAERVAVMEAMYRASHKRAWVKVD